MLRDGPKKTVVEESKKKKIDMTDLFDFPVLDCTQEQNDGPYFSFIAGCKEIHFYSLLFGQAEANLY